IMLLRGTNISNPGSIYVMNADGSNLRKLFNLNFLTAAWSPDGVSIVAQGGLEICTVNVDNTNFKCLTNNNFTDSQPNWQRLPNPNPPANITGHVKDNNGNPLQGIKVTVAAIGSIVTNVSTDANGFYSVSNVPHHFNYIIIPDENLAYDFVPANKFITDLTTSEVVDFVGTLVPTKLIAGRVVEA